MNDIHVVDRSKGMTIENGLSTEILSMSDGQLKTEEDVDSAAEFELLLEAQVVLLGFCVKTVRSSLDMNQLEFGKKCGISARTLHKIESGFKSSDLTALHKISAFFKRMGICVIASRDNINIRYPADIRGGEYGDIFSMLGEDEIDLFSPL